MRRQGRRRGRNRDWGGELNRIAVRTGGDRRERDRQAAELVRELDSTPMARCEQRGLSLAPAAPDRADGVKHVLRGKCAARGGFHVSGVAASEKAALLEDRRPSRSVDRAVDTAAAEEPRIRGVDDRVDLLLGDVTQDELDHAYDGRGKRTGRSSGSGINPCAKPVVRYRPARPPHS